jgi:hypothetical protein
MKEKKSIKILAYATLGSGSHDEIRIKSLTSSFCTHIYPFDRSKKFSSFLGIVRLAKSIRPSVIIQEGTGFWGGMALLWCRFVHGIPYIFSTGDAVGPFLSARYPIFSFFFNAYEKILCRCSRGVIGWTPYLVGRAITLGASRGVTAEGFAITKGHPICKDKAKRELKEILELPKDSIIFGIVGSLKWSKRFGYCYGMELVRAIKKTSNHNVFVVIAGDGDGLFYLKKEAGDLVNKRIFFIGRIPYSKTIEFIKGLDFATLPQSCDQVGALRYTTKVSEYIEAKTPFFTNQIPMAYDLGIPFLKTLAGNNPWDTTFINELSKVMDNIKDPIFSFVEQEEILNKEIFSLKNQTKKISSFIEDLI